MRDVCVDWLQDMIGCWKDFFFFFQNAPSCGLGSSWIGNQPRIQTLGGGVQAQASGRPVWRARESGAGWGRGISAGRFLPGSGVGSLETPGWLAAGRRAECGAASGVLAPPPSFLPHPHPGVVRLGSQSPPLYWIGGSGWRPWLLFKSQANLMLGQGWSPARCFRPA